MQDSADHKRLDNDQQFAEAGGLGRLELSQPTPYPPSGPIPSDRLFCFGFPGWLGGGPGGCLGSAGGGLKCKLQAKTRSEMRVWGERGSARAALQIRACLWPSSVLSPLDNLCRGGLALAVKLYDKDMMTMVKIDGKC